MDWWLLTFFLGAILSLFLPEVPALFQLFLLLCLTISFFFHKKLRFSSGLLLGSLWMLTQAYLYHNQLPSTLVEQIHKKQAFVVEGEVLSIQAKAVTSLKTEQSAKRLVPSPQKIAETKRFNFLVSKVNHHKLSNAVVIRLSWKKATIAIAQGQKLSLKVKLKPAHGLSNIGSFNYLSWLKANNISATGYVINPKKKKVNTQYVNRLVEQNSSIRQQLYEKYQAIAPDHELTPILMALAFGERSSLTATHWQILQATGTSHLIAISGLHVGLLASGAYLIVMLFIRYLPVNSPSWQSLNIRYLAIFISLLLAVAYAYLAGFSLPTQRALVMLLLYWLSRSLGIRLSAKRLLLITLFILVIISPFSLFTVSFWLSFYAVLIIFLTLWRFRVWLTRGSDLWRFVKGLFIIQIALTLMLIPITAIFFQQVSLVSLAANIIAVPWMSVISIPCALLSVFFMTFSELLAQWFMTLSLYSLTWLWHYLTRISELSYASISLSGYQQSALLCAGALVFIIIYLLGYKYTKVVIKPAAIIISVLISWFYLISSFYLNSELNENDIKHVNEVKKDDILSPWQVVFFDVGQGLSVLIKRNGHGILFDTGAAYPSGFNMSEAVILPYLQYIGMGKLDKVILSHSDNDHAGGLAMLEDEIIIDEIISNDTSISNRPVASCYRRKTFNWRGLTFKVLSPVKLALPVSLTTSAPLSPLLPQLKQVTDFKVSKTAKEAKAIKQKNDDSCVVLISDRYGKKVLLTGDISRKIEKQLLINYPELKVDILQVPHHGSKTSSSQAFIKQLSPQLAVVSAGYLNRWYMPSAQVRQRYQDENIPLINSAEVGQVIVTIEREGISVQNYVDDLRPFWFSH